MIKYEKLWRIFAHKIVKFGKGSSLPLPAHETWRKKYGEVEQIQYQIDEINTRVEKQFGFHKTLLWEAGGRKQDSAKGYKEWRIFMAEVTKKGGSPPEIVENAEKVTTSLHNTSHKNQ